MSLRGAPRESAITIIGRWLANADLNSHLPSAMKLSISSLATVCT